MIENNNVPDNDGVIRPTVSPPPPVEQPVVDTSVSAPEPATETPPEAITEVPSESVETKSTVEEEDDIVEASEPDTTDTNTDDVDYPRDKIDFRGEDLEKLADLIKDDLTEIGDAALDVRVRTVGSWENLIFRAILDQDEEEIRIQDALKQIIARDKESLSSRYRDPETNKTLLRTAAIKSKGGVAGETKSLTGDEAVLAFENMGSGRGGGYSIPLYNSGVVINAIVPTGNDFQTMLTNCAQMDRQLGTSLGAHYFTYADLMYKTQVLNFIQPLIINSSYSDWRKKGKLWSVVKITDLPAIVMTIAAMCYKDGFDGFVTKCTRPKTEDHPDRCTHTETITANLFEMIVTRFSVMSKEAIDFMVNARMGKGRNSLTQIAKYQSDLGLEGERLTFDDVTFTMRIPTVAEYLEGGSKFLSDIINEIEGDNSEGQYEQMGFRYIRTFLPWIATVEKTGENGEIYKTAEPRVIVRELEKHDDNDPDGKLRDALRAYINKVQLTYVGYPVTQCPSCGYTADTPSGMWTFDPFSAFFTLASLFMRPPVSTPQKG